MTTSLSAILWRLLDWAEAARGHLWPRRFAPAVPWLFLAPALLVVGLLVLGLVQIGDASLRTLDTSTYLLSEELGFENYAQIAGRPVYLAVLWRSLLAALLVTAITLVLAFPYAYAMVRTPSAGLRKLLLVSLFLPFFIGQVVRAYGWLIVLGQQGLVNGILGWLGLGPYTLIYTYPTIVVGLVQYMLPFAVLVLAPALVAIPDEVEMAAESLGARWWQVMLNVVVPMARPGLVGSAVVVFTISLTDFAIPRMLGGGANDFIANTIYDAFFRVSDAGLGSALTVVLVLVGSTIVAAVFSVMGAGTLGFRQRAGVRR